MHSPLLIISAQSEQIIKMNASGINPICNYVKLNWFRVGNRLRESFLDILGTLGGWQAAQIAGYTESNDQQ